MFGMMKAPTLDPTKQCVSQQYTELKVLLLRLAPAATTAASPENISSASTVSPVSTTAGQVIMGNAGSGSTGVSGGVQPRQSSTIKTILKLTADPAKNINLGVPQRGSFAQMAKEFKEIDDIIVNQDPVEVMLLYSKSLNNHDLMVLALRNIYGQEPSSCKALNLSFSRFLFNLSKVFPMVDLLQTPHAAMVKSISYFHPEVQVFPPSPGKEYTVVSQAPSFKGVHLQLSRAIRSGVLDKLLRQTGSLCFPFESKARLAAVNRYRVLCQPIRKKPLKPLEKRAETIGLNSKVFLDRAIKLVGDENLIITNRKKAFRSLVSVLYKGELELHEKSKKLIFVDVRTQKKYRSCPEAIKGGVLDKLLLQTGVIALKSSVFDVAYERYRKITQATRQAKAARAVSASNGSPGKGNPAVPGLALPPPPALPKPSPSVGQPAIARSPYVMKATSRGLNGCNNRIRGLPMGRDGSPSTRDLQGLLLAQAQYEFQNKISPDSRKGVAVPKSKLVTGGSSTKKNEGKLKQLPRYSKGVNKENAASQNGIFSPATAQFAALNRPPPLPSMNGNSLHMTLPVNGAAPTNSSVVSSTTAPSSASASFSSNSATIKDVTNSVKVDKKQECGNGNKRPREATNTCDVNTGLALKMGTGTGIVQDQNVNSANVGPNVNLSPSVPSTAALTGGGSNNSGRWTNVEHARFLKGLGVYGEKYVTNAKFNWREMAQFVRTRDPVQVRTHAQKYFIKLNKQKEKKRKRGEFVESSNSSLESKISDLLLRINPRPLKKEKRESHPTKAPSQKPQSSNERLDRLTIADLQSAQQMLLLQSQPFAMQSVLQPAAN